MTGRGRPADSRDGRGDGAAKKSCGPTKKLCGISGILSYNLRKRKEKSMRMMQDGVEVCCLPDNAYCSADVGLQSPLDLCECPIGNEECCGDCWHYREDDERKYLVL